MKSEAEKMVLTQRYHSHMYKGKNSDFLSELVVCFRVLNNRPTHRDILRSSPIMFKREGEKKIVFIHLLSQYLFCLDISFETFVAQSPCFMFDLKENRPYA